MESSNIYGTEFCSILKKELLTAMGCTEPGCIAFCAAKMRQTLGCEPETILAKCSGNLIKNAKGATVPNSGGLKGIEAACILGAVGGDPDRGLEAVSAAKPEDITRTRALLEKKICTVELLESDDNLDIILEGKGGGHTALTELKYDHTNIIRIEKDGKSIFTKEQPSASKTEEKSNPYEDLTVRRIIDFAEHAELKDSGLEEMINRQIACNSKISEEGLTHSYGAQVGRILLKDFNNQDIRTRAQAFAAAGSDARMSGCEMPVVINSGSGNQGITVTMPVIEFAQSLNKSHEELVRALIISNLVAIHIKACYGRLSAFCGSVSAAAGSGAAITWMSGGTYNQICGTIVNTLGTISGMVCDGAKPSCASKISAAVDAAIQAHYMSMEQSQFSAGDGLVKDDIEETIRSIGRMASEGMIETDKKILQLMLENDRRAKKDSR